MFAWAKRLRRARKRFVRAKKGAAAVEFAFVVLPFFLITFGTAEIALIGLAQSSLNFAVSDAGRQIRTGQAQANGVTEAEISQLICDRLNNFMMMNCVDTLFVDVQSFNSFVDVQGQNNPLQGGNFDEGSLGYQPGGASDIVVVRAFYRWRMITPMFETFLSNVGGSDRVLVSTMMFRNEPF
jgi:Flp pilus assembly protein TadG